MDIYLASGEERKGPYSKDAVRQFLADGQLDGTELAWHEGMGGWVSLTELIGATPADTNRAVELQEPKIFISYRRHDSDDVTQFIYKRLTNAFPEENIFIDVDDIPIGYNFIAHLQEAIAKTDMMLVIIGPRWFTAQGLDGQSRLDDPNDFVRIEVEAGLSQEKTMVVPTLVGGATMPSPGELPECLRQLASEDEVEIRTGPDFERDVTHIIQYAERHFSPIASISENTAREKNAGLSPEPLKNKNQGNSSHDVFLSYSRSDQGILMKIIETLRSRGISIWTDEEITPGTPSWKASIQNAIEKAKFFVIILTPDAKQSENVEMELGYALAQQIPVLPVLARGNNRDAVPMEIINRQWTDITADYSEGMERLVETVQQM